MSATERGLIKGPAVPDLPTADHRTVTAQIVHVMRDASGLSMMQCRDAAHDAVANLSGDFVLALLVADANGLAVAIRSKDPAADQALLRRDWNIRHAGISRADISQRSDAWRRLDAVSPKHVIAGD